MDLAEYQKKDNIEKLDGSNLYYSVRTKLSRKRLKFITSKNIIGNINNNNKS